MILLQPSELASFQRKWKSYPAYKESGAEWLREVPENWELKRLKFAARFNYGDSLAVDAREDGEVEVFGSNGPVGLHSCSNTLGPALIIGRKGSFGKVNLSPKPCFAIDTTYFIDARSSKANLKWLFYVLPLLGLDSISEDSAIPGLSREFAHDQWMPLPPEPEQRVIVHFLDRETAKIDALRKKKERLIELLQEKRAAIINQAVTKGLNPNVLMKDYGVEWLGAIPEHWEVKRNTVLFRERDERGFPELPILDVSINTGVNIRQFSTEHIEQKADDPSVYKRARSGDIAFNKMRMWQGAVGVAPVDGLVSPDYTVAAPLDGVNTRYFGLLLRTTCYMTEVNRYSHGIVPDRNRLYWDQFKSIRSICPPLSEQNAIVDFVDRETAKIDSLIAKVREGIETLKEYRTALISAAVTGKIDVRESNHSDVGT